MNKVVHFIMSQNYLMANFQRELFADFVPESGLLVMARGLGLFQIIKSFVALYASPQMLVFLLGASPYQEAELLHMFTGGEEQLVGHTPFKVIKNDAPSKQRLETYLHGGVISTTSRIMLIDLLKERIPSHLTTGIIILGADRVTEFGLEAFVLELFRSKNHVGFIKAFCDKPEALIGGFAKLEKTLKFLKVSKLFLYPRFHATVKSDLDELQLEAEELHVTMTSKMKIIQLGLLEVMETCLNELLRANNFLDAKEFNMETAVTGSFDMQLRRQLDPVWHRVSFKSKQLINELRTLRILLEYLVAFDAVSYCKFLETLVMADASTSSTGEFRSYWLMLDTAQTVIQTALDRVYSLDKGGNITKTVESMPKWTIVDRILEDNPDRRTLIMVTEEHTRRQLIRILALGHEEWQTRKYDDYLRWRRGARQIGGLDQGVPAIGPTAKKRSRPAKIATGRVIERVDDIVAQEADEIITNVIETESIEGLGGPQNCQIKCFMDNDDYDKLLNDENPDTVVLYDGDLAFLRAIELYSRNNPGKHLALSILVYKESTEEQQQLLAIRQEKEAFEDLIKTKSTMAPPTVDPNPIADDLHDQTLLTKFLGAVESGPKSIIVDLRELRSSLPFILYRHGFSLEPRTIEIGDYILSPEICVERKSVSDLISSLTNGRLYYQIEAMTRHYGTPVLLIEFDENKPFSLLPGDLRSEISMSDVSSKLCLLVIHFPKLRIVWSSSLANTADIFRELKRDREEPVSREPNAINEIDPTARDLLQSMPGINASNCYLVMRHVKNMHELCQKTLSGLTDLIGSENALKLHNFLHGSLNKK